MFRISTTSAVAIASCSVWEKSNRQHPLRWGCCKITKHDLLEVFEHLQRMASYTDSNGKEKDFLSCILKHVRESSIAANLKDLLQITYGCGHCPKLIFSVFIAHLIMPERKLPVIFELQEKKIFRPSFIHNLHLWRTRQNHCQVSHITYWNILHQTWNR